MLSGACSMSMMMKSRPAEARISIVSMVGNFTNIPRGRASGAHRRSLKWLPMELLLARECGAFDQRREFGPLDLGVHPNHLPTLRKSAVGAGDDVLLADHAGVVLDP